jgi:hypothetical protein
MLFNEMVLLILFLLWEYICIKCHIEYIFRNNVEELFSSRTIVQHMQHLMLLVHGV